MLYKAQADSTVNTHSEPSSQRPPRRAGNGHNGAASKADCIAAIEHWTKTRRVAEALSVDELAELDPGTKLLARDRAELEAIRHVLLKHPRESALFGVFKAISFLSDDRGCCDLSQERLARFFGRGRQHINDCIRTLKNDGVIREDGESVKGKPARFYPVVAHIFAAESIHRTWFFDAFAPYEPARPGRKPKDRSEIPVAATATPISEIPVVNTATPISKYLSPKTEIPVAAAATQNSLESPVVEEEKHTGRSTSKGFNGQKQAQVECSSSVAINGHAPACLDEGALFQSKELILPCSAASKSEEVAGLARSLRELCSIPEKKELPGAYNQAEIVFNQSGDLFGGSVEALPTKAHFKEFAETAYTFNYPEDATIPPRTTGAHKHLQKVCKGFAGIVKAALEKSSRSLVLEALDYAVAYTGSKGHKPEYGTGPHPALSYFSKTFKGELGRLKKAEHAERVDAQKRQALAEIEIEGAKAANGKKLAALDSRIQLGNDAAAKRIASASKGKDNRTHDERVFDAMCRYDERRDAERTAAEEAEANAVRKSGFKEWEDVKKIGNFQVKGSHCQNIEDAVPGATSRQIRNALEELRPPMGRYGPTSVNAAWVERMVIEKLTGGEKPRSEIIEKLVESGSYDSGVMRSVFIDETAKEIGATELEVELAKEVEVVRERRNYRNGHYTAPGI
jgi:hypothetical protein